MTIYIDVLIFTNILINYCLLSVSKIFLHAKTKHIRIIVASILGSFFSLIVFVPIYSATFSNILKIIVALIMCLTAFKYTDVKTLIKYVLTVFILCTIFGGTMIAFYQVTRPKNMAIINDVVYFHIKPTVIISISIVIYILFILFQRLFSCDIENTLVDLKFKIKNKEYECVAKIDTGNSVVEPFSGAPVIVAEKSIITEILNLNKRVVPYKTINGTGILYAVKACNVYIDKKEINKEIYIGVYDGVIDSQIKAIINSEIIR